MLVLLADTRKKLLWLWLGAATIIGALVFVQTLTGKFEAIEQVAWLWFFVHMLPVLFLLFVGVVGNHNPSKVLKRSTFWALYAAGVAYLLFVLATLLALPVLTRNLSIADYLCLSYTWLTPFQGVLLVLFGIMYFRKTPFFQPDPAIIREYVSKKADYARRSGSLLQTQALDALTHNEGLDKVLMLLSGHYSGLNNDLTLLQGQYANWKHSRDLNLAAPDVLQREMNRMTLAAIDLIENIAA